MTPVHHEAELEHSGHFLNELRATFAARSNKEAICYGEQSVTFGALHAAAWSWACNCLTSLPRIKN
jgi:hypothetical protein